jgi:carbamoyltransferase
LGLLYSAFTQRIGMKPNEEEYILMGMSAIGVPKYVDVIRSDFVEDDPVPNFRVKANVHRGIKYWRPDITDIENIASSIQFIAEEYLTRLVQWVRRKINSNNLVLSGGVALNCVANSKIAETRAFENIWIMPNPGDSGSSIGAIAAFHKKKMNWESPYLGYDINRPFDFGKATEALINGEVIAIANGRAEFGPRALGNRSLICDPRGRQMKDKVNAIKKRERFRPFAPVILEDMVNRYFEMPIRGAPSPYMQFVAKCKYPDLFPAICHFDNTSRVQTLSHRQNPVFYELLSRFHRLTGCPMLLNTSLNIKGEPLVNTWDDAIRFSKKYNVTVF